MEERESLVKKVARISVVSNILLTIGKLFVGLYGDSEADVFVSSL